MDLKITLISQKGRFLLILFCKRVLGNLSPAIRTCLQNNINRNLPFCEIKVIFKSTARLGNFLSF